MKNQTTKFNKSKLAARVMLLIFLITGVLSMTSCTEPNCEKGEYYATSLDVKPYFYEIKVVSNKTEFPIDDVTINLCVGIQKHQFSIWDLFVQTNNSNLLSNDFETDISANIYYLVFVHNASDSENEDGKYEENVFNYATILKEIPLKDAHNYIYTKIPFSGYYYNNCETITIPQKNFIDVLDSEYPQIIIGICKVEKSLETGKYTVINGISMVSIFYSVNDDTVTLHFQHRNQYY